LAEKLDLPDIGTLGNPVSARAAINSNFTAIENAFDNTLSRDGDTPNQMEADIDMNGNDLLNVKRIDADELYKNGVPFEQTIAYADKKYQLFDGTGAQINFPLTDDPGSLGNLEVSIAGVLQRPGIDFTYNSTTLTFISAPASGTNNILVRYDRALPIGAVTAAGVSWNQVNGPTQTLENDLRRVFRPEHYGADPAGALLSDTAFATCAALGKTVELTAGATYYLSSRVVHVTGSRFVCRDGWATIKVKTGAGGFNNVSLNASKDENSVFFMSGVDDVGVEGVRFITDGVKEVTLYPVRIQAGCTVKGADVHRLEFNGLSAISGGYFAMNSIGAGGVRFSAIRAVSCGTAQGNTYWTGTPQITVVEVDNDLVGGVHSNGNAIHGNNVGALNVLLTGTALTNYGQQTDCVNVAGISATQRKGPTITDIWADGVGEVLDVFGSYGTYEVSRARNAHVFVVKLVHGAQGNRVEVGAIESCGLAAVSFAGSNQVVAHTANNTVHVRYAAGVGDSGTGPTSADTCAVLVQENSGTLATCLPRNNTAIFDHFLPGSNTDYAVKDNCTIDNDNGNRVIFDRLPSGMGTAFGTITVDDNTKVTVKDRARVEYTLTANQTPLTSGVDTTVSFNEVQSDRQSQMNTGTFKVRLKAPGIYQAHTSVRTTLNSGDDVAVKIFKNAAAICQAAMEPSSGALGWTYKADKTFEILPSEAGTSAADIFVSVNITSAGTITLIDTNSMTFFEVNPVT